VARPRGDDHLRHKRAPEQDAPEQEQEETTEQETQEPEHARMQNQLGNQAMVSMLPRGGPGGQGAGIESELAFRDKEEEQEEERSYGGDGDGGGDGPLTIEDLLQSWNPGIKRTKDRGAFLDYMPDDDLPPEDEDWVTAIRQGTDTLTLPAANTVDHLLQPSAAVVASALGAWSVGVSRWAGLKPDERTLAYLVRRPPPFLQDPEGRVLISRLRASTMAMWLLLQCPTISRHPDPATSMFVSFCLEFSGRARQFEQLRADAQETVKNSIPMAKDIVAAQLPNANGTVDLKVPGQLEASYLHRYLNSLLDFTPPQSLVPTLVMPEPIVEEEEDDPLGLDALLDELTGDKPDQDAAPYQQAIRTAEKLAAHAARTRVDFAGAALVISQVADMWTVGAPHATLLRICDGVDVEVGRLLQLLVEIARAAQQKSVQPMGLHNGLSRGARTLAKIHTLGVDLFSRIIAAIIPGEPNLLRIVDPPNDFLSNAWSDGQPGAALDEIKKLPDGIERQAAIAFTRGAAGESGEQLLDCFLALRANALSANRPLLAAAAGTCAGPCLLAAGKTREALKLSAANMEFARQRRNGLAIADAAVLGMEAHLARGEEDLIEKLRYSAGRQTWLMGAEAALTLLARWAPPTTEEQNAAINPED
jgi:hypothetical protein